MNAVVQFDIHIPQVARTYEEMLTYARRAESGGITSFWLYDHLYAPGLPNRYSLEGWVAVALLAQTSDLRLGHLVLNNNFRHPVMVAKMAATLDMISGGRLNLGVGSGSNEFEHLEGGFSWGTTSDRAGRLANALEIITAILGQDRSRVEGPYYQTRDVPGLPRPAQRPGVPIYVGGIGPRRTLPVVARYADVWNVPTYGLAKWDEAASVFDAACSEIGPEPGTVRRSLEAVLVVGSDDASSRAILATAERRYPGVGWGLLDGGFTGSVQAVVDRIGVWMERGFTEFVFFPADRGDGPIIEILAEEIIPAFQPGTQTPEVPSHDV